MSNTFSIEIAQVLFDSLDEFPVNLDDAWIWIGYAEKRNAKDSLISAFIDGKDFLSSGTMRTEAGRQSEVIMMTVECFKMLGMMAKTEKGKEIRRYFLDCEATAKRLLAEKAVDTAIGSDVFNTVDRGFEQRHDKKTTGIPDLDLIEWVRLEIGKCIAQYGDRYPQLLQDSIDVLAYHAGQAKVRLGLTESIDHSHLLDISAGRDMRKISIDPNLIRQTVDKFIDGKDEIIVQTITAALIKMFPGKNVSVVSVGSRIQYYLKELGWQQTRIERLGEGKSRTQSTFYKRP